MLKWSIAGDGMPATKSCRSAAAVAIGLLIAAATAVGVRAAAGALQSPLEPVVLLTTGVMLAIAVVVVRLGWLLPLGTDRIGWFDAAVMAVASLAMITLCSGLCSPRETPAEIAMLVRAVIVIEEGWAWLWFFVKRNRNGSLHRRSPPPSSMRKVKTPDPFILQQQMTRGESEDGAEMLSGSLRLAFAPGQRTGSAHVAFCPPLRAIPEMEVLQVEGPEARIKMTQLLPYGARFDLKLAAASEEPTTVVLAFTARCPAGNV